VINTRVDWSCSGGSSIAAAFEVAYALNQQERQGGSSDRMVIAAAAGPSAAKSFVFGTGRWRRAVLGGNGCPDGFLGVIKMK